jgi:hypothetical protein
VRSDSAARDLYTWPALDGTEGSLEMFTVFERPLDFPAHFVVRRSFVLAGGETKLDVVPRLASDLDNARQLIPPWLHCQPRHELDEPQIVEVWF